MLRRNASNTNTNNSTSNTGSTTTGNTAARNSTAGGAAARNATSSATPNNTTSNTAARSTTGNAATINREDVKLWVNGREESGAHIQAGQIIYTPRRGGPRIVQDDIQRNNTQDCLSQWTEKGVRHITYNPDMKDAPVKLRRERGDVFVTINVAFSGAMVDRPFVDIDSKDNKTTLKETYAEVALAGIKRQWHDDVFEPGRFNCFGDDERINWKVSVNEVPPRSSTPHLRIRLAERGQPICLYNILWSIRGNQRKNPTHDINLTAFFGRHIWKNAFMNLSAHEIGHTLGLGDAYEGFTQRGVPKDDETILEEIPLDEIMRSDWNNATVGNITVEMILEAFRTNSLQRYDPRNPSRVIQTLNK